MVQLAKKNIPHSTQTLEEVLRSKELIRPSQVFLARTFMGEKETNFGTAVMFLEILPASLLGRVLRQSAGIRHVRPKKIQVPPEVRSLLSAEKARELQVFPLSVLEESGQKVLLLGMTDPLELRVVIKVESLCRIKIQPVFLGLNDLQKLYRKNYGKGLSLNSHEFSHLDAKASDSRIEKAVEAGYLEILDTHYEALDNKLKNLGELLVKKDIITREDLDELLSG